MTNRDVIRTVMAEVGGPNRSPQEIERVTDAVLADVGRDCPFALPVRVVHRAGSNSSKIVSINGVVIVLNVRDNIAGVIATCLLYTSDAADE